MLHYYRKRAGGKIEHSTTEAEACEVLVDRTRIEALMGWPTPAMALEYDENGETGWYIGTTETGRTIEEYPVSDREG